MDQREVRKVLARVGAVLTNGHFVYTSGKHGSGYVNKDGVYPHTLETSLLCGALADLFVGDNVEVVIGPTTGGAILSQWTAYQLSELTGREVLAVYTEKEGEGFVIGRGYEDLVPLRRVLVVEDVLTTGGSARKVVEVTRAIGGNVIGLGVLCNRGGITPQDVGVPKLTALVNVTLDAWDEAECPLCRRGVPINTKVGKGREFLVSRRVLSV